MIKSKMYGRDHDVCMRIPEIDITSADGQGAIVKSVYKRDSLSIGWDVYKDVDDPLQLLHSGDDKLKPWSYFLVLLSISTIHTVYPPRYPRQ